MRMGYVYFHKPICPRDFPMTIFLASFNWNGNPTIFSHHLIGLKIRLESHIFVLSAAAVAAEMAASEATASEAAAEAEAAAAVALPASDIL